MKLFHFIKSKLSAATSKLVDNDPDTVEAVINSEIAKGKNPLQTLCIEEARLNELKEEILDILNNGVYPSVYSPRKKYVNVLNQLEQLKNDLEKHFGASHG